MSTVLGFKGQARISVLDRGREIFATAPQKNLLLDQGMDRMADVLICDLFAFAVKGSGNEVTKELVDVANSYTSVAGVVTRTGAARDFVAGDVGKWLAPVDDHNAGAKIASVDSVAQVTLEDLSIAFAAKDIVLYSVQQTGLETEAGVDAPVVTYSKPAADGTVTASGSAFSADDVGRAIRFPVSEIAFLITSYTSATIVEVDITDGDATITAEAGLIYDVRDESLAPASRTDNYGQGSTDNTNSTTLNVRTFKRTFIFAPEEELATDSGATTASRAGTTVTASGAFFAGDATDVGKVIAWDDGTESEITGFTSTTVCTVANSGAISAQLFTLYGYHTYEEVGFSDLDEPGGNLNIRIALAAPVKVLGPTGLYPGRQLKVVYELELTVTPHTSTSGNLAPIITGGSSMNANQAGNAVIESLSTSRIDADGSTNNDFALLDPATPGYLAFSTNSDALSPLGDKVRDANTVYADFEADDYSPGAFYRTYRATFGSEEAIGLTWRSLFLGDQDTDIAVYTFLFGQAQKKEAGRVFSMTLTKTWARDLNP